MGRWHVLQLEHFEAWELNAGAPLPCPLVPALGVTDVDGGSEMNYERDFCVYKLTVVCGPRDCSYKL